MQSSESSPARARTIARPHRRPPSKLRAAAAAALVCAAVAAGPRLLHAHHSFAAEFDANAPVTLQGTVSRLDWTNPHAWLYLNVAGADGKAVLWAIELSAPSALARRGFRHESVRPGAKMVVKGYRAKNGTPTARGWYLTMPDGRTIELGNSSAGE
jgi:hypothetical protein